MPRRNQGARLRWLEKRHCFYITWTERGRSRECSTGSADREQAEAFFASWLPSRGQRVGPGHPNEILLTELLTEYAKAKMDEAMAPRVIGYSIQALAPFWQGKSVADVTKQACRRYGQMRGLSINTVRRERAAINFA